jgi:hypothetical protein
MTLQTLNLEQKIPKSIYNSMHTTLFCGVNAHKEKKSSCLTTLQTTNPRIPKP